VKEVCAEPTPHSKTAPGSLRGPLCIVWPTLVSPALK
jgi:hypothetical protein